MAGPTDRHAELGHALHFDDLKQLSEVPWSVMSQRYWPDVKEERQAEFLVREFYPWSAFVEVVVKSTTASAGAIAAMRGSSHRPPVLVRPEWYY